MKRRKRDFQLYTGMWLVAIFVLLALMWQNAGDARVINYSGIVRGATQKLVKEELNGHSDDKLIETLDGIIDNLQTGKGPYRLMKNSNEKYQRLLAELKLVWEDMKKEIVHLNSGSGSEKRLYDLSQRHFEMADRMVSSAEVNISEDHISEAEHSDMEDYFTSKLKIFERSRIACVNLDMDKTYLPRVLAAAQASCEKTVTFGFDSAAEVQGMRSKKERATSWSRRCWTAEKKPFALISAAATTAATHWRRSRSADSLACRSKQSARVLRMSRSPDAWKPIRSTAMWT